MSSVSVQPRVLRAGSEQGGEIGVGALPDREELLECPPASVEVAEARLRARNAEMRKGNHGRQRIDPPMLQDLAVLLDRLVEPPPLGVRPRAQIEGDERRDTPHFGWRGRTQRPDRVVRTRAIYRN